MNDDVILLRKKAINAALEQKWQEAVEYNSQILSFSPDDIQSLNRLGFAQMMLGFTPQAKVSFERVLELDSLNPIATKNIQKINTLKPGESLVTVTAKKKKTSFIEEPGVTKTVALVRPGKTNTLFKNSSGTEVTLVAKKRRVSIETFDGEYIGCLPDDVGLRLDKLLRVGYKYQVHIKSNDEKNVSVFIRETLRSEKLKNSPSFPGSKILNVYADETHNRPYDDIPVDISETGDEDFSD